MFSSFFWYQFEGVACIRRELLEDHNSLPTQMNSATLICGRFPFLAPVAERHVFFFSFFFVCILTRFSLPLHQKERKKNCYTFPSSHVCMHSSRHWADRHSSSAGTLAQVDQVSLLPEVCAACAFLWLCAAQLEVLNAALELRCVRQTQPHP